MQLTESPTRTRAVLIGIKCSDCGTSAYPKQPVCPKCMSQSVIDEVMPDRGVVYAFSTVHAAPKKWPTPYTIGYVDLPNEVRVFTHLDGPGLEVGDTVTAVSSAFGANADGSAREQLFFISGDVK